MSRKNDRASNPYQVHEDGLGIHVIRHYPDGDELYIANCETRAEADSIAAAEHEREQAGGLVP